MENGERNQVYFQALPLRSEPDPVITVIVEYGNTKVVVPRDVYEAQKQVERSKRFENAVGQIFRGAESDTTVTAVRIDPPERGHPGPEVPRKMFSRFDMRIVDENGDRVVVEYANLEISRAILARGKRKWEFFWRGMKISAPVTDDRFYDKFFAHEVTIAPGDVLKAVVRITRRQDKDSGIYMNHSYEVIEVIGHMPRVRQASL